MKFKQSCYNCAHQTVCAKATHIENYSIPGCIDYLPSIQEESEWVISYDGYYPYCKKCGYEPERPALNVDNRTPFCPNCGRKMRKERC